MLARELLTRTEIYEKIAGNILDWRRCHWPCSRRRSSAAGSLLLDATQWVPPSWSDQSVSSWPLWGSVGLHIPGCPRSSPVYMRTKRHWRNSFLKPSTECPGVHKDKCKHDAAYSAVFWARGDAVIVERVPLHIQDPPTVTAHPRVLRVHPAGLWGQKQEMIIHTRFGLFMAEHSYG